MNIDEAINQTLAHNEQNLNTPMKNFDKLVEKILREGIFGDDYYIEMDFVINGILVDNFPVRVEADVEETYSSWGPHAVDFRLEATDIRGIWLNQDLLLQDEYGDDFSVGVLKEGTCVYKKGSGNNILNPVSRPLKYRGDRFGEYDGSDILSGEFNWDEVCERVGKAASED